MTLSPGQRLGSYEVVERLGVGGMGEVYLARDHKLDREVALKVLPEALARDPRQRARLEREARLLASLNHPNIATIHDFGVSGEVSFLVLELVPGENLAERLARGPVPLSEALRIAREVAEALQAAHEQGIIHRDLKPSNIKISPAGRVKVLDFGLAKVFAPEESCGMSTESPTFTLTQAKRGFLHGTPGYMSPEQARGGSLNHRTDIWSFGCVLYELLSGGRAFAGDTVSDRIAATLEREPAWNRLPAGTPKGLRKILRRCLEKDQENRPESTDEVRKALVEVREASPRLAASRVGKALWALVGLVAVAALLVMLQLRSGPGEKEEGKELLAPETRTAIPVAAPTRLSQITSRQGVEEHPCWSPQGDRLAFTAEVAGVRKVFFRNLESGEETQLTRGPSDDIQPAWSADGGSILFVRSRQPGRKLEPSDVFGEYSDGDLWRLDLATGQETKILDEAFNPSYAPDGMRLAVDASWVGPRRIWTVDAEGRNPKQVSFDDSEAVSHLRPRWSPDGTKIVFQNLRRTQFDIKTVDLVTGESKWITNDEDQDIHPVWSGRGDAIYFSSPRGGGLNIWRAPVSPRGEAAGRMQQITTGSGKDVQPGVSREGNRLAFTILRQNADLWQLPVDPETGKPTGSPRPLTASTREDSRGAWSPDGRFVAFNSDRGGTMSIWVYFREDGSLRQLTQGPGGDFQPNWAPDGTFITFFSSRSGNADVWVVDISTKVVRQLTRDPSLDINPCYSPDGKQIAFQSDRGGRLEVWLMNADGGAARQLTHTGVTGHFLRWSLDGRQIFFRSRTGEGLPTLRVAAEGGAPAAVGPVAGGSHLSLSPGGEAILDAVGHKELWVSPLGDGEPARVFAFPEQNIRIDYPVWSPDGKWILFDRFEPEGGDIWLMEPLLP